MPQYPDRSLPPTLLAPVMMIVSSRAVAAFAIVACVFHFSCRDSQDPPREVRGVWLTNVDSHVLESREGISEAMQFLADHHFNAVFPVVWNKGYPLYPSAVMDSAFGVQIDPLYGTRDPLAELIAEAHARELVVIPWFEFGFSPSHDKSSRHILDRRPEWAARDQDGNILTKNGFHWMNAYHPDVQQFMRALVLEVVRNYDIDGIQGDDRLPAQPVEGGYSQYTTQLYKQDHAGTPPPRAVHDAEWIRWRARHLSHFARSLANDARSIKPGIIISWAPSVFPWSREEYLQDWPTWINEGVADLVIPQVYRYSIEEYRDALATQAPESLGVRSDACLIVPGVLLNLADYVMPEPFLDATLELNRRWGYRGEVFFFYEGLRKDNDRVARFLVSTYYSEQAILPLATRFSR